MLLFGTLSAALGTAVVLLSAQDTVDKGVGIS